MWDPKARNLAQEGFRRRPQSPLRGARARLRGHADDEPAVERAPYEGVGAELKAAREQKGRELAAVCEALNIQPCATIPGRRAPP